MKKFIRSSIDIERNTIKPVFDEDGVTVLRYGSDSIVFNIEFVGSGDTSGISIDELLKIMMEKVGDYISISDK
jgi:hypothetical protein